MPLTVPVGLLQLWTFSACGLLFFVFLVGFVLFLALGAVVARKVGGD